MRNFLVRLFLVLLCLGCAPAFAQHNTLTLQTVNSSVTITTGNTFQQVLPAVALNSAARRSLTIQNNNASDSCWITFGLLAGTPITATTAAKASSILLTAGQGYTRYYPYIPTDAIIATCATSSDTLYVDNN